MCVCVYVWEYVFMKKNGAHTCLIYVSVREKKKKIEIRFHWGDREMKRENEARMHLF